MHRCGAVPFDRLNFCSCAWFKRNAGQLDVAVDASWQHLSHHLLKGLGNYLYSNVLLAPVGIARLSPTIHLRMDQLSLSCLVFMKTVNHLSVDLPLDSTPMDVTHTDSIRNPERDEPKTKSSMPSKIFNLILTI